MKQWTRHIQATNHLFVLAIYSEGYLSRKRMKAPYMKAARNLVKRPVTLVDNNANKREFAPLIHEYGVGFLNPKRTIDKAAKH